MSEERVGQSHAVLDIRVRQLEMVAAETSTAVKSIAESLKTLAQLEVEHRETRAGLNRAFSAIKECNDTSDKRLKDIEIEMPGLKQTKAWVYSAVAGVACLILISAYGVVVNKDHSEHSKPASHSSEQ